MPRLVNQSSVDENIVIYLQYGLLELTVNDNVIAREIQQQYQNKLICNDAAIALEIQQEEEACVYSCLHDDEGLARTLQDLEGNLQPSLSDDETLARYLQEQDESANNTDDDIQETHHRQYQSIQVNPSYLPQRDAPSTTRAFFHYDDGENFSGHYTHTHSPSNISHNPPDSENIDPTSMTYEELSELEDSIGDFSNGLSQERISRLRTHKYGTQTKTWCCWLKKKKFVADDSQCSICLVEYAKGDKITTLPCKHIYHKDCISRWLKQNKVCCVCKAVVYP
ncbi:Zinc finger RING-type [Arabidopsis thaliana x Arabidopsis arenosa]|uniref:Zinc finger RING-type n=1 Tax=Arabidopsis thaliana x Arabidopsis arenosa TaxID=1240361 RepID=A0A8T2A922_9BRAS|nr:Zinc finger RING-type [Arabidopsis thaliana x Arabidopsis arenosa]